jgi:hypothetical protein
MKKKQREAKKQRAKEHAEAQRYLKKSALESGQDMEAQGYIKTQTGWRRLTRRRNKPIDKE